MKEKDTFYAALKKIAFPVTVQSLLQSSFGVADQMMTGQLGSTFIAGIGLAGKFCSVFSTIVSAVAAVAGIMMAQYLGKREEKEVGRSFYANLLFAAALAVLFTWVCCFLPEQMMALYTGDVKTRQVAADYLAILGLSCVPMAMGTLLAALLRCREAAGLPLFASIAAAVVNTAGNYVLIFGKFGFPELGAAGAAIATVLSQCFHLCLLLVLYLGKSKREGWKLPFLFRMDEAKMRQYTKILVPMLVCEFLWILGENVYAIIYGHIGTAACAAMTVTSPVQGLFIGALSGLAQAASIITGKSLGSGDYGKAYGDGKRLMLLGLAGAAVLSLLVILGSGYYVRLYRVEDAVRAMAEQILWAFALVAPVKVLNMILGGGILRSGGKTKYVMYIDMTGTWMFGVPLGILGAFVLGLPIAWVYFLLSLEECVRLGISLVLFRKRVWMNVLE